MSNDHNKLLCLGKAMNVGAEEGAILASLCSNSIDS